MQFDPNTFLIDISFEERGMRARCRKTNILFGHVDMSLFGRQFLAANRKVNLNFSPISDGASPLAFSESEQIELRSQTSLQWVKLLHINGALARWIHWSLDDTGVRSAVRELTDGKYGVNTKPSIRLAAHTLRTAEEKYRRRVTEDTRVRDWNS